MENRTPILIKRILIILIKTVLVVLILLGIVIKEGSNFKYLLNWSDMYMVGYNLVTILVLLIGILAIYLILKKVKIRR
jgi:hypothetical protein